MMMGEQHMWTGADGAWAYERHGDRGPGILLLHGLMFDRAMWRPIAEDLARDHVVVAVDLPGHGASPARESYRLEELSDELDDLTREAGIETPLVAGHSAAALLATVHAARHHVHAVVNVDQPLAIAEMATRLQQIVDLDDQIFAQVTGIMVTGMHLDSVPAQYRDLVVPRPRREVLVPWWQQLLTQEPEKLQAWLESVAGSITAPYLAVLSREPWSGYGTWLADLIPGARCDIYEIDGHFPHLTDLPRFTASLRELAAE